MDEVESLRLIQKHVRGYDKLSNNMKYWLNAVVNRLGCSEQDFVTYLAMSKSDKDMSYLDGLGLREDLSYYVVSQKQEFLEKFRIYMQVYVPKKYDDYIAFTEKVTLNSYLRQVNDPKYDINEMLLSRKRLQVYCHKNNHMTDKQTEWIQGNLFTSDICDRLLKGSKILILAEYAVKEIDEITKSFKLRKIEISDGDMEFHGLYNSVGKSGTDDEEARKKLAESAK